MRDSFEIETHPEPVCAKIESLRTPAVIGQTYDVPTIRIPYPGSKNNSIKFDCPVLGADHNDKIYGFGTFDHFHVDMRFLEDYEHEVWVSHARQHNLKGDSLLLMVVRLDSTTLGEIKRIPLVCRRAPLTYQINDCRFMVERLEPAFKDHSILPKRPFGCKVCPHRGTPLGSIKPTNGVIVCPAHGLAWDEATGKMIPRTQCEA